MHEPNDRKNENAPSVGAGPGAKGDARPSVTPGCDSLALGPTPRRRAGEAVNRVNRGRACVRPPPRGALRPGPASSTCRRTPAAPSAFWAGFAPRAAVRKPYPKLRSRRRPRARADDDRARKKKKYARAVFSVAGSHINSHPRRRLFARIFSQTIPSHITFSHASFDLAYSIADRPRPLAPRGPPRAPKPSPSRRIRNAPGGARFEV